MGSQGSIARPGSRYLATLWCGHAVLREVLYRVRVLQLSRIVFRAQNSSSPVRTEAWVNCLRVIIFVALVFVQKIVFGALGAIHPEERAV